MKILYITTIGDTMRFFKSIISELIKEGHSVDIATNEGNGSNPVPSIYKEMGCRIYPIPCSRSPMNPGNLKTITAVKKIVANGKYDIVHCHTPIAAACTRIACRSLRKKGLKVFYTAHGFHFYTAAPKKNWLIYYPIEWLCSWWTDVLITINKEDFERAAHHLHAQRTEYVPGVGIDTEKFKCKENGRKRIRAELNVDEERTMFLSVGELNENKNHETVIRAITGLPLTYVVVGSGARMQRLAQAASECNVDLRLTGYRNDVADFYDAADAYILSSIREGLNVSLMEAMAASLPCLCGKIRGNTDLIDERGGHLFNPTDIDSVRNAVIQFLNSTTDDPESRKRMGAHNIQKIRNYDFQIVDEIIAEIYRGEYQKTQIVINDKV